jgi:hypothetical protein
MKVLKASEEIKNKLDGFSNGPHLISFQQDKNGNWVIPLAVKDNPVFQSIHEDLLVMEEIEWEEPEDFD